MKRFWNASRLVGAAISFVVVLLGCAGGQGPAQTATAHMPLPNRGLFVGSGACATCHSVEYATWTTSGHHHGLAGVVGGAPPSYPYTPAVTQPPPGFAWDDIAYVVGGAMDQACYVDQFGYVITGSACCCEFVAGTFGPYEEEIPYPSGKPCDCGACHATGWVASTTEHQDDRPGMVGTWNEEGVACEACHGPANLHTGACAGCHSNPPGSIIAAPGNEVCGRCHVAVYTVHLESGHATLSCTQCHDPHAKMDRAVAWATCLGCHPAKAVDEEPIHAGADAPCSDCHDGHRTSF